MMLRRLYASTHASNTLTALSSGPRCRRASFILRTSALSIPPRGSWTPQIPHTSPGPPEALVEGDELRRLVGPVVLPPCRLQAIAAEALREARVVPQTL